ncbi:MAG: cytidylyltransferase domain-containing protein [Rhodospirillales bacterium]
MPRFVASIEARMGSSRLPGKVLEDLAGAPALTRLVRRLRRARRLDGIVLATTTGAEDDALARWAEAEGVACFRGSEDDVLARVVEAQRTMTSDVVVEVCGDTPLLDPVVVDMAIDAFESQACDVVTTTREQSFPDGIDAEVFRLADLEEVAATVADPAVREHVSLHFYQQPDRYRVFHLPAPPQWRRPEIRLVLDEPADLERIREIYARLEPDFGDAFGTGDIIDLIDRDPALAGARPAAGERAAP